MEQLTTIEDLKKQLKNYPPEMETEFWAMKLSLFAGILVECRPSSLSYYIGLLNDIRIEYEASLYGYGSDT